ncbi:MAG: substrate-binding domain-containing protein [Acetobacteraceae bacterium]|nr:substrate-binding domain-containing protein [Acetobacteraceae bacterium]
MSDELLVLGSMATRALLAELVATWDRPARALARGGVEAVRRVREGEAVDVLVLAEAAMRSLEAEGLLLPDSLVPLVASDMAVAVRSGTALPDLSGPDAPARLRAAGRIGYSTGPSGDHLLQVLQDWGLRDALNLVQAPPGIPVGQLLADGAADLGFQQQSELISIPGLAITPIAPPLGKRTLFFGGIPRHSHRPQEAATLIASFSNSQDALRRHGLQAA